MNYPGPYHGVLVPADSPYDKLDALLEGGKSGTITYGTAGAMGGAHLAFVSVAKDTGANLQHVSLDGASKRLRRSLAGISMRRWCRPIAIWFRTVSCVFSGCSIAPMIRTFPMRRR